MNIKHIHYTEVKADAVEEEGAKGVKIRWLINKDDGAPHFAMRLIEVREDGHTPWHAHEWEHEVFILKGSGKLVTEKEEKSLKEGDIVFVSPQTRHQFKNSGQEELRFLCMVPHAD